MEIQANGFTYKIVNIVDNGQVVNIDVGRDGEMTHYWFKPSSDGASIEEQALAFLKARKEFQ